MSGTGTNFDLTVGAKGGAGAALAGTGNRVALESDDETLSRERVLGSRRGSLTSIGSSGPTGGDGNTGGVAFAAGEAEREHAGKREGQGPRKGANG